MSTLGDFSVNDKCCICWEEIGDSPICLTSEGVAHRACCLDRDNDYDADESDDDDEEEGSGKSWWNYRIIEHNNYFGLHEVYYRNGRIEKWCDEPEVVGSSVEEVIAAVELMLRAAKKYQYDVLSSYDMPGNRRIR